MGAFESQPSREIHPLVSKRLRELVGGELTSDSSSAFLTVVAEADFLYFLPITIEINCTDSGWYLAMEIVGRAVGDTEPANWTADRKSALINILHAAIRKSSLADPTILREVRLKFPESPRECES